MTVVELNAWAFEREYQKRIVSWINRALPILLEELKRLTPEDTKEMLNSFTTQKATIEWDSVVWIIWNDADHAIYVEYWVNGLSYTYHKPKGSPFYRWVGNRTFARALDNKREEIIRIIYNEINR